MTIRPRLGPLELLHENPRLRVYRRVADFGSFRKTYYLDRRGRRVGVVVPRGDAVLLVRQYRLLVDGPALEIPGGTIDEDETAETAAKRECLEETGWSCDRVESLVFYLPGMDAMDNPTEVFIAHDIAEARPFQPDPQEVEALCWLPLTECLDKIATREIVCGMTVTALLAYAAHRKGT